MTLILSSLSYSIQKRFLIQQISLSFQPGVLYGILGPNGSGKSTLLKTISRIWKPSQGQINWKGEDLLKFSRFAMSQTISLVAQTPSLYFDFSVYQMVKMGCYSQGRNFPSTRERIESALQQADLLHLQNRFLSELSGGERQRVYIARALATGAPVLLLDEPTSYLDLRHQLEIWQLLCQLKEKGKLILVALHDFFSAERFCDEIVVLHEGKCPAKGTYSEVMTPHLLSEIFGVARDERPGFFHLA